MSKWCMEDRQNVCFYFQWANVEKPLMFKDHIITLMVYYATLKLMIVRGCDNSVTWAQFHQHLTSSFCERRSQEHKLTDCLTVYFCAFGIYARKSFS